MREDEGMEMEDRKGEIEMIDMTGERTTGGGIQGIATEDEMEEISREDRALEMQILEGKPCASCQHRSRQNVKCSITTAVLDMEVAMKASTLANATIVIGTAKSLGQGSVVEPGPNR